MNLFLLHENAIKAALVHCDKHCVKMILETCQILYTAWHVNRPDDFFFVKVNQKPKMLAPLAKIIKDLKQADDLRLFDNDPCPYKPYKCTHKNHPSAKWVRAHKAHYDWAIELGLGLCAEYTRRYGKTHKCQLHLDRLSVMGFPKPEKDVDAGTLPPLEKRAFVGVPEGCEYFDCAINDEVFEKCAVRDKQGRLNGVETYRNYYGTKKTDKWTLKWNKGKDDEPKWYIPTF
jgi:hypothetical protein